MKVRGCQEVFGAVKKSSQVTKSSLHGQNAPIVCPSVNDGATQHRTATPERKREFGAARKPFRPGAAKKHLRPPSAETSTVNVFFRDMSYTSYSQTQATTLTAMLGNLDNAKIRSVCFFPSKSRWSDGPLPRNVRCHRHRIGHLALQARMDGGKLEEASIRSEEASRQTCTIILLKR